MTELLHKMDSTELWECRGHTLLLALPNWGTMGVYAQIWSGAATRWELLWHLERPAIVRALKEKSDILDAVNEDRRTLLDAAELILGGETGTDDPQAVTIREGR